MSKAERDSGALEAVRRFFKEYEEKPVPQATMPAGDYFLVWLGVEGFKVVPLDE